MITMMTKKHYIKIAEILKDQRNRPMSYGTDGLINAFCELLSEDNPRFDIQKFKEACGI
jgi:L-ascorbate metabolism protein UlaG (beta-lactamase superfamily)